MHFGSDPLMPYSTGTTPPTAGFRLGTEDWSGPVSLSASPEQPHNHIFRRNRAFGPSNASPPARRQPRPSPAESALGPFANSAVTWGVTTTFGSGSKAASDKVTDSDSADPMDPITITMFNGPLIDDCPLLSPKRRPFYRAYIEAYADLLFAWGLTISRLEMLKFSAIDPTPASPILVPARKAAQMGLEIAGFCSKCGGVLDVTSGARGECKACKRRQVTMNCVICEVIVKGLYGACLNCGHVAHATCWRGWFEGVGAASQDRGCPTGCGCACLFEEEGELLGSEVALEPLVVGTPGMARDWDAFEGEYLW